MANSGTLRDFLESRKATDVWTHTSLAGGKYFIPQDDLDTFQSLQTESILDQEKQYLTEKCTDIGPLRIDFDFIQDREITTHKHTKEQVIAFTEAYMNEIAKYLEMPKSVDIYIMEKRKPTLDAKKNRMKSGIHMVVPDLKTHKFINSEFAVNS